MIEGNISSTHPPLPPTTEDTRFSWLRLLRSRRVGPVTFHRLIKTYGSAQNALEALPKVARDAGVKGYEVCPASKITAEIDAAKAAKARLLRICDPGYPPLLKELPDAPPVLWVIGDMTLLNRPTLALVGARNASSLGQRMARSLANQLGEAGYIIASGLARGIDTAAHEAALDHGTIAVMAGGVDVIYPTENAALADQIASRGVRLSEQPMGLAPMARHFPKRNRIIAGLSRALIVVEAAARSGSLITARDALDLGREVMAVPGHPFDARASGCNMLIRDGAQLVRGGDDVLAALPPDESPPRVLPALEDIPPPAQTRTLRETAALHQEILQRLGPSPVSEDQLIREIASPARDVAPALTDLEMQGEIDRHPGGFVCLKFNKS